MPQSPQIDHDYFGEGTTAHTVSAEDAPGWSDMILVRGSECTALHAIRRQPTTSGNEVKFHTGLQIKTDTRHLDPQEVSGLMIQGYEEAGWNPKTLYRNLTEVLGEPLRAARRGSLDELPDLLPLPTEDAATATSSAWDPLKREDVLFSEGWPSTLTMITRGARPQDGGIIFDADRAKRMGSVIEDNPILRTLPSEPLCAIATDIDRGNDALSSIARNTDMSRKAAIAASKKGLESCGIDDPASDAAKTAYRTLRHIPDGQHPSTPDEMRSLLMVSTFGKKAAEMGLRSDAEKAFLEEASVNWERAGQRIRSAGKFTVHDSINEARKGFAETPEVPTKVRHNLNLTPHISLREATHLCRKQNTERFEDRLNSGAMPEIFPERAAFEGGSVREIRHSAAYDALDLNLTFRESQPLKKQLSADILSGDAVAFAVYDQADANIGAIIANRRTGENKIIPGKLAHGEDMTTLAKGGSFLTDELLPAHAQQLEQREQVLKQGDVRLSQSQLSKRNAIRHEARATGEPLQWALAKPYLPSALRQIGPDAFAIHYENQVAKAQGIVEASTPSTPAKPPVKRSRDDGAR